MNLIFLDFSFKFIVFCLNPVILLNHDYTLRFKELSFFIYTPVLDQYSILAATQFGYRNWYREGKNCIGTSLIMHP